MDHHERLHQGIELTGTQQVGIVGRTPPESLLRFEEGLGEQKTSRGDGREDLGHPSTIQIVEYQHGIEAAQVRPFALQIDARPVYFESTHFRFVTADFQAGGVLVDCGDLGTQCGGRERMSPAATGQVEHFAARLDPIGVPGKPAAGPFDFGGVGRVGVNS